MIAEQISAIEQLGDAINQALDSNELDLALRQHVLRDRAIRDVLGRYSGQQLLDHKAALEAMLESIQAQQVRARQMQEDIAARLSALRRQSIGNAAYAAV